MSELFSSQLTTCIYTSQNKWTKEKVKVNKSQ